jgi:ribonuclease E
MLVNMTDPEECRVAVVEDGRLEELFIERESSEHHVGNVYKGRVENVEPSIQAAFVDCGLERNGFLHVSDVNSDYFKQARAKKEQQGQHFPKLQNVLHRGQEVVVQVTKSGIGTKGPALTTYLSLAGRYLVLMPSIKRHGVSRKIEDEQKRLRLKSILQEMKMPDDMGVIVRTAGEGHSKRELQRDLNYLLRLYSAIEKRIRQSKAPSLIYQESDLVTRVIRDFFTPETDEIIVDNELVHRKADDFLKGVMPRYAERIKLYSGAEPLFHAQGIEEQIENIYARRVDLPGGGYVVIDQTEALVAIDVNSGSYRERSDPEQSAYHLNMRAAGEVARQLRLRDLGGVIVIDFIDMFDQKHRRDVEKELQDALKKDKARYRVLRISDFGIVEMTRQRMRPSVRRSLFLECPHCKGTGVMRTVESVAASVLRQLALILSRDEVARAEVSAPAAVVSYLNNSKRRDLADVEVRFKKAVIVNTDLQAAGDAVKFTSYDKAGVASEWNQSASEGA